MGEVVVARCQPSLLKSAQARQITADLNVSQIVSSRPVPDGAVKVGLFNETASEAMDDVGGQRTVLLH